MKFFNPGTTATGKIFIVIMFGYLITAIAMRSLDWPSVLQDWEGDTHKGVSDFRSAIASIAFLLFVSVWLFIYREHLYELKANLVKYIGILFLIFFMPLSGLLILGITSNGFKINPVTHPESLKLYDSLNNIQFYCFIGFCVLWIFYAWKNKTGIFANSVNAPLPQSHN